MATSLAIKQSCIITRIFVLYALGPFKRRITLDDGKTAVRQFKGGEILWSDEQSHIGENVGQTNTQVLIVEQKESTP